MESFVSRLTPSDLSLVTGWADGWCQANIVIKMEFVSIQLGRVWALLNSKDMQIVTKESLYKCEPSVLNSRLMLEQVAALLELAEKQTLPHGRSLLATLSKMVQSDWEDVCLLQKLLSTSQVREFVLSSAEVSEKIYQQSMKIVR